MPNATVRANARRTPKAPPGSAASVRRKTAELKTATALLKEARPIIESVERELGIEPPTGTANGQPPADYPGLDEEIHQVLVWTSLAANLVNDVRLPKEMTVEQRLTVSQLDNVVVKAHEAAQALHDKYHGEEVPQ